MKRKWHVCLFVAPIILILAFILIGAGSGKPGASGAPQYAGQFLSQTKNLEAEIVPGVVAVKIKSATAARALSKASTMTGLSSLDAKLQRFGATRVQKMFRHKPISANSKLPDISRILRVRIPQRLSPVMVAQELEDDPNVEYAEPVYVHRLLETPNDPMYSQQPHLPKIQTPLAWNVQKGDSAVIIGIVDTGVDYRHVDLADNVWTNELEANGMTGADDDGNGFVDDIHGWDFGENDPDPADVNGHGTMCAGLACAVTNNNVGVAGVTWNCEYMPVKIVDKNALGEFEFGFDGIIYAADNGADVISNSWGGSNYSKWEQEVINYAYGKGAIIVCGAGNGSSEADFWPAAYQHSISVAGVSLKDIKASYSCYGPWIDICAPSGEIGEGLATTLPGNTYYPVAGGTSISTPIVAGVLGLVKSLHPDWSNDQIVRQVLLTADNIDDLNPQSRNKLGHGRVNAYRALTATTLTEPDARLEVFSCSIDDSLYGNNDGLLNRGETIMLHLAIQNCSIGSAPAATVQLSSASADIEILNGTAGPVSFPADTTLPFDLAFRIADQAIARKTNLIITMTTTRGYSRQEKTEIVVGEMPLLLVDYDMGYPNVEPFFRNILDNKNLLYTYWDTQPLGFPNWNTLSRFPIVIVSESTGGFLNEQVRAALRYYLDGGGHLFICGQNLGYWSFYEVATPESKAFLRDYFHVEYIWRSEDHEVQGVENDPISQNLAFHIWQPKNGGWQWPEVIRPLAGASPIFTYSDGRVCAAKYAGDYKVVYLGFGFEAVDSDENTQIGDPSPIRTELLMRILDWLNFVVHEPLKDTEEIQHSRPITAKIKGSLSDLQSVTVWWRLPGEIDFKSVQMSENGTGHYAAEIPGPGAPSTVEYYLQAAYPDYNWRCPLGSPDTVYAYYAGPDTVKPEIAQVSSIPNHLGNREPCPVTTVITDNLGIDSSSVYAHYRVRNKADSVLLLPSGEPDHFAGRIPAQFSLADSVEYRMTVRDLSVAGNTSSSAWQRFIVGYEDFENGLQSWLTDSSGWNLFGVGHWGKHSVCTSPSGFYPFNQDITLASKYGVDLSQTDKAVLTFWTAYFIEQNKDFGYIEISSDSGVTWQRLATAFTGTNSSWEEKSVSLSDFTGPRFHDVRVRFRFMSDSTQAQALKGWFIDDIRIIPDVETAVAADEPAPPRQFALYQNYPNPFNPSTTIEFALPKASFVTLKIFGLLGNEVATLVAEKLPAGKHQRLWEAKGLASGVYLYRLEADEFVQTKKLILLR